MFFEANIIYLTLNNHIFNETKINAHSHPKSLLLETTEIQIY